MIIKKQTQLILRSALAHRGCSQRVQDGGIDYLFARWQGLINDLQQKKVDNIDEYCNDVSVRSIVEFCLQHMSDDERLLVETNLKPLDANFKKLTQEVEELGRDCHWEWWQRRVPHWIDGSKVIAWLPRM